jgi:CMP-N,N'-diacetyllegionaminic acid synthase
MKNIIVIIPVRMGSKRLKNKNILKIKNKPMFVYVAHEVRNSKFKPNVYISSESKKVMKICKDYNLNFVLRPKKLALDHIEKQDVIAYTYQKLKKLKPEIIISLQPNSPEFQAKDLDQAITFFKNSFKEKPIKEVISVGKDNLQNGAFRIMTPKTVCKKTLSTNVGIFFTDYIDVHYLNDYKKVKKKIEKN